MPSSKASSRTMLEIVFLPLPTAHSFQAKVNEVLSLYSFLAQRADAEGLCLWRFVPKLHYWYHLGERCVYLNPRVTSCWIDEDYVGKVKAVVVSCTMGTPMHSVPAKVAEKLSWVVHIDTVL